MKILKPILAIPLIFLACSTLANADEHEIGEHLYKAHCAVCHGTTGGMDMNKRIAPPIAAVRMHYIGNYPDQASFVSAVTAWVEKPDENNTLMRGAIRRFKLMPPLTVSNSDAEKIAAYIYAGKLDTPEGMEQHVQERHGKKGMPLK